MGSCVPPTPPFRVERPDGTDPEQRINQVKIGVNRSRGRSTPGNPAVPDFPPPYQLLLLRDVFCLSYGFGRNTIDLIFLIIQVCFVNSCSRRFPAPVETGGLGGSLQLQTAWPVNSPTFSRGNMTVYHGVSVQRTFGQFGDSSISNTSLTPPPMEVERVRFEPRLVWFRVECYSKSPVAGLSPG